MDLIESVGNFAVGGGPIGKTNPDRESKRPSVANAKKSKLSKEQATTVDQLQNFAGLSIQNSLKELNHNLSSQRTFLQNSAQPRLPGIQLAVGEITSIMKQDQSLLQKRLVFIRNQLEHKIEPMRLVSRDHARTNKNGLKLEYLEKKGER